MTFSKIFRITLPLVFLGACSFRGGVSPDSFQVLSGPLADVRSDGSQGRFAQEEGFDAETGTVHVAFSSQVRLLHQATQQRLPAGLSFEVCVSDSPTWPAGEKGQRVLSTSDGDVLVEGKLSYQELGKQQYQRKYLLVRSPQHPDSVIATEIHVNPWQRGELFYRDAFRQGTPHWEAREGTQLTLSEYSAVFQGRDFEIDPQLQLTTLRRFAFTLRPQMVASNPQGDFQPKALRPGTRFRLTGVLADPSIGDSHPLHGFLSGFEAEVEIDSDRALHTTQVLPVTFTQALDTRTQIHLKLEPVGGGQPLFFSSVFQANPNGNDTTSGSALPSARAFPIPKEATRALPFKEGTGYALKMDWGGTPLELLAAYVGENGPVERVALNHAPATFTSVASWDPKPAPWKALWDLSALEQHQQLLRILCERADLSEPEKPRCLAHPELFFEIARMEVVDSVENAHPQIANGMDASALKYLQLSATYLNETGVTQRETEADKVSEHWIGGVSTRVGIGLFGNEAGAHHSYNLEGEWYRVKEASQADQTRARLSTQEQIVLSKEEIRLDLDLKTRRCLWIHPGVFEASSKGRKSFLFCDDPEPTRFKEAWYMVQDRWNHVHTAHTDPKDPRERGWTKLIRGREAFAQFERAIGDKTSTYVFEKVVPFFDGVDSLVAAGFYSENQRERLHRDGGIFPGVLQYREMTQSLWYPHQVTQLAKACYASIEKASPDPVVRRRGEIYCRFLYEGASRKWTHAQFTAMDSATVKAELKKSGLDEASRAAAIRLEGTQP